jgi:hypothetical protein
MILYLMALAAWILVTCAIWCAAILMYMITRTRTFAWPMSLAAAVTFPFVFAYQIMVAPIIFTLMLGAFALWRLIEPVSTIKNPVVIVTSIIAIFGSGLVMFVASVAGYADGWRTGWGLARGHSINEMLPYTILGRWLNVLQRRT